jgi:phosphoenolpyruvate carboxykinase (ATP)
MDDFIIGAQGRKVNAFHDIVMDLSARFPGKVHFLQYNTGGMGEIIEIDKGSGKKKLVRKVQRVPIDLMAALQRGDLRGSNDHTRGRLGTEYVTRAEGLDLSRWDAGTFYSDEQIEWYVADLVDGRRAFTEEIAGQGLRPDIRAIAHRELDAMDARVARRKVEPWASADAEDQTAAEDRDPRSRFISPWEPRRGAVSYFPNPAARKR